MDDCMKPCCGVSPRRNVSDLFDRGRRRARQAPLEIQGQEHEGAGGLVARFSLSIDDEKIGQVGFQASTCITLIAYCELIAEIASGTSMQDAARLSAADLVAALPDVPALKRDRAPLAIMAFRGALVRTLSDQKWGAVTPPQLNMASSARLAFSA